MKSRPPSPGVARCGVRARCVSRAATVIVTSLLPLAAASQETGANAARPSLTIVPRVSVAETYTNNALLQSGGKRTDLVTQVSPGIRISSNGGRIRGTLDFSLNEVIYANNSRGRQSQNALNATGSVELVDNWAFIDLSGSIGQQAISAFGTQSSSGTVTNGNSTETSVFRMSPYIRGRLAGVADYEARYSLTSNSSQSAAVSNVNSNELALKLTGVSGRPGSGWSVQADSQTTDYSAGRSTRSQRVNGQVNVPFNQNWGTYLKANHESNNFGAVTQQQGDFAALGVNWTPNEELRVGVDKDTRGATGLTVNWAPSKRASLSIVRERRLFGDTHSIAAAYRTESTAWTFSDSRSAVTGQPAATGSVSLYDLLTASFANGESDPVKREQYDAFLLANGIKPGAIAVGGFLSSSVSLQRQQQLSFALFGARSTLAIVATRSTNTKLDTVSAVVDDFSTSSVVQQTGLTVNLSHRLTPRSVLSLAAAQQRSSGAAGQPGTSLRSVNLNLSHKLTPSMTANVGARRAVFDSSTAPYSESAVTGNLSVQF